MSSARTYDAALPLPSVFVAKMKSVKDCLNMTETIIPNCRLTRGKIRVKNQSLHEDLAHACAKSPDLEKPSKRCGIHANSAPNTPYQILHTGVRNLSGCPCRNCIVLDLSQFAISSSPIPIRAQAAVLSRISSIRQLATDELREQRHLQGNHSNHQLATDDLRLVSPLKTDVHGDKKCVTCGVTICHRAPAPSRQLQM